MPSFCSHALRDGRSRRAWWCCRLGKPPVTMRSEEKCGRHQTASFCQPHPQPISRKTQAHCRSKPCRAPVCCLFLRRASRELPSRPLTRLIPACQGTMQQPPDMKVYFLRQLEKIVARPALEGKRRTLAGSKRSQNHLA